MDEEIQKAKKLIVIQVGISVTRQNEQDGLDKSIQIQELARMALTILIPPDSIIAVAREVMWRNNTTEEYLLIDYELISSKGLNKDFKSMLTEIKYQSVVCKDILSASDGTKDGLQKAPKEHLQIVEQTPFLEDCFSEIGSIECCYFMSHYEGAKVKRLKNEKNDILKIYVCCDVVQKVMA
ncbi:hypothetical protein HPP92_021036 [Vanilla planifolia]|nr:hypothetical protein HPP92_021036 [Vanilla planifolia]